MNEDIFQVEQIEAISFDENGQEDGTWEGWSVTLIDQPSKYCFDCRDKLNADELCDFLNNNMGATSINAPVMDNLAEWSLLVTELSTKEIKLEKVKKDYDKKEFQIKYVDDINFKELYGRANDDTRKYHVEVTLQDLISEKESLELSINYLKRRISFLKQLIHTKTVLTEIKE